MCRAGADTHHKHVSVQAWGSVPTLHTNVKKTCSKSMLTLVGVVRFAVAAGGKTGVPPVGFTGSSQAGRLCHGNGKQLWCDAP